MHYSTKLSLEIGLNLYKTKAVENYLVFERRKYENTANVVETGTAL